MAPSNDPNKVAKPIENGLAAPAADLFERVSPGVPRLRRR
jgi:hypothetical protein